MRRKFHIHGSWLLGLLLLSSAVTAATEKTPADHLIVLSPHPMTIREEFIPAFTQYYLDRYKQPVLVDWLDQGGTRSNLLFIRSKYASNKNSSGFDVFWGGGIQTFESLTIDKLLESVKLPAAIEKEILRTRSTPVARDGSHKWYPSSFSSFGIIYDQEKLRSITAGDAKKSPLTITNWSDLARPELAGLIAFADPHTSSVSSRITQIILESEGLQSGWETLVGIIANSSAIGLRTRDTLDAVTTGKSLAGGMIDFYGYNATRESNAHIAFVLPKDGTVIEPDPIGILKGAPHRVVAERFIEFVESRAGQGLLSLRKGAPSGPKLAEISRIAVNKTIFDMKSSDLGNPTNPFTTNNHFDSKLPAALSNDSAVLLDWISVTLIDNVDILRAAWTSVNKSADKAVRLKELMALPLDSAALVDAQKHWNDHAFRTKKMTEWSQSAKARFQKLSH